MLLEGILSEGYEGYFHSGFPPPFVKGRGGTGFLNAMKSEGNGNFSKLRGKGEFLKFSLGGQLLEIKLQTENKISE